MSSTTSDAERAETAGKATTLARSTGESRRGARYIREFDGLRGLSILLVILYHCWLYQGAGTLPGIVSRVGMIGWAGVDIFFVLSGFLISGILLDTRETSGYWRNFVIRRGLRIFPLYYAVLILLVVDAWMLAHWGIGVHDKSISTIDRVWVNFLYLTNFSMAIYGSNHVPMNIAWSLAIEEQFYLVYPVVLLWCGRKTLTIVLLMVVVLAPLFRAAVWMHGPQPEEGPYVLPFCRMDALAMGALAQLALRNLSSRQNRILIWLTPLACLAALTCLYAWTRADLPFVIAGYTLNAIAASGLLMCVLASDSTSLLRKLFGNSALVYVGKLAYGLYLLHLLARALFDGWITPKLPSNAFYDPIWSVARLVGITGIALAMATGSYFLFEMPILRLKDRWAPSQQRYQEPVSLTST